MVVLFPPRITFVLCATVAALLAGRAQATQIDLTDFAKNRNIFTDLNQQFPHTDNGSGTPGSDVGTPNASFLYTPSTYTSANFQSGSNRTTNGVSFDLVSDAAGQDYAALGGSEVIAVGASGVQSISILGSAYFGQSASFVVTGADGTTQTFSNDYFPDFNGGVGTTPLNDTTTDGATRQTTLIVQDVGAGGSGNSSNGAFNNYNLTEFSLPLNAALQAESITSVTIIPDGSTVLILGATAVTSGIPPIPEPSSALLLLPSALAVFRMRKARL